MLHARQRGEKTLLSNAAFLSAIYVDPTYQVLLQYFQKTVVQAHLAALWRRLEMLLGSIDATDLECLDSSSESENDLLLHAVLILLMRYSPFWLRVMSAHHNYHDMSKCFNNQSRFFRNTNIFEWWDKQAESDLKRVANVILTLPISQASVEVLFRV